MDLIDSKKVYKDIKKKRNLKKRKKLLEKKLEKKYILMLQQCKKEGKVENTKFKFENGRKSNKEGKLVISENLKKKTKIDENQKIRSNQKERDDINRRETKDRELANRKEGKRSTLERDLIGRKIGNDGKRNKYKEKKIGENIRGKIEKKGEK